MSHTCIDTRNRSGLTELSHFELHPFTKKNTKISPVVQYASNSLGKVLWATGYCFYIKSNQYFRYGDNIVSANATTSQAGWARRVCQLFSHKSSCFTSGILTLTSRGYFFYKTIKKRRLDRKTTGALAALDISGSTWAQWIWKKKLQQQYPFRNHACSSAHCDRECCSFVPPFFVLSISQLH